MEVCPVTLLLLLLGGTVGIKTARRFTRVVVQMLSQI